jgi:hypothetical protein
MSCLECSTLERQQRNVCFDFWVCFEEVKIAMSRARFHPLFLMICCIPILFMSVYLGGMFLFATAFATGFWGFVFFTGHFVIGWFTGRILFRANSKKRSLILLGLLSCLLWIVLAVFVSRGILTNSFTGILLDINIVYILLGIPIGIGIAGSLTMLVRLARLLKWF